jgi:hypothetical protein
MCGAADNGSDARWFGWLSAVHCRVFLHPARVRLACCAREHVGWYRCSALTLTLARAGACQERLMRKTDRAGNKWRLGLVLALCSMWASTAAAEELTHRGNLVFAAERMFGLYIDNQSIGNADLDYVVVALGWNRASAFSALTTPRLGVDYFFTDNFTVGGALGFYSANRDSGALSQTTTGFLLNARAGYAFRLGHSVCFWPRGGLTFNASGEDDEDDDQSLLSLTLDAPFTLAPTEQFAFLAGPVLEVGIAGGTNGLDYGEVLFGLMLGLQGWFEL